MTAAARPRLRLVQAGQDPAAECARCFRSRQDHQDQDDGTADDIRRRIWRALGQPCRSFADTLGTVFAENQASRARAANRDTPHAPAAPDPRKIAAAERGAAAARLALGLPARPRQPDTL